MEKKEPEEFSNAKRAAPEPSAYAYTQIAANEKYELGDSLSLVNWTAERLEPFQKNFYPVPGCV